MNKKSHDTSSTLEDGRLARALLRRLMAAHEDERRRLTTILHDDIGQQVTALRLALERHQGLATSEHLATAIELTATISREVDAIAWQLRPAALDELGLGAALPRFVDTWSSGSGIPAGWRVEDYVADALSPAVEVAFYRIMQEALDNVAAHAHATRTDVVLAARAGQIVLIVEDNGVGFDAKVLLEQEGLGLAMMRERATLADATLVVESMAGRGTSVVLKYSLPGRPEDVPQ